MRKYFSTKLYLDGLKQLRLIGIMSTVIVSIFSIIVPIGLLIDSMEYTEKGGFFFNHTLVTLENITPFNYCIYLLFVPIMCLYLFNFLTKRNSCDFYHAVPLKREGVYLSFYAAIVTWMLFMLTLSTVISLITIAIIPSMYIIVSSIFVFYLKIFAASILVSGGFMLAISLTGTTFTNLVVAVIVLICPRIYIASVVSMLRSAVPYIKLSSSGILFNYNNNLLVSTFTDLFTSARVGSIYSAIIYSLVLGIIYIIIGCLLFVRRKSEAAGNSAINKKLQLIFRLVIAFTICLIPCYTIFSTITEHRFISISTLFIMCVIYTLALIAYFLYELITTRKLENIIKAIPGVGILALANILLIAGLYVTTAFMKNTLPDADDIRYFNIYSGEYGYESDNYISALSSQIKIDDTEAIETVADLLKSTAEMCTEDTNYLLYNSDRTMDITIKSGLFKKTYTILYKNSDYQKLINSLNKNEEYRKLYTRLPDLDKYTYVDNNYVEFSDETLEKLYNSAKEELAQIGFEKAYSYFNNYNDNTITVLNVTTVSNLKQYTISLDISKDVLPKTYSLYIAEANKYLGDKCDKITALIKDYYANCKTNSTLSEDVMSVDESLIITHLNTNDEAHIQSYFYNDNNLDNYDPYAAKDYYFASEETLKLVSGLADHLTLADENVDITRDEVLCINYYYYISGEVHNEGHNDDYAYYIADSDGLEIFEKLCRLQNGEEFAY